jgi:DNA polymerase/3'-5' exonuclease PolX
MNQTKTYKRSLTLQDARITANTFIKHIYPFCRPDKCMTAGSVRRRQPVVGDIEIVCIPKMGKADSPGELFRTHQNLVINYLQKHYRRDKGIKILKGGPRYQQLLLGSTQIDLFMPLESQWGRILALRTGPAALSKRMATRWCELGYKGVDGVLVPRPSPEFPTEKSFFDFLNWSYKNPENR